MTDTNATPNPREVAAENDRFRKAVCSLDTTGNASSVPFKMELLFRWVAEGDEKYLNEVLAAVAAYGAFTADTDPSGLHQAGVIERSDGAVAFAISCDDEGSRELILGFKGEMRDAGYLPN